MKENNTINYTNFTSRYCNDDFRYVIEHIRLAPIEYVNKRAGGNGGTTFYINLSTPTIVVLQNKNAVENKVKKHPHCLGVIEGINTDDINAYLLRCNKSGNNPCIITTAASLYKVMSANISKSDYIVALDECEFMTHKLYRKYYRQIKLNATSFKRVIAFSATPLLKNCHYDFTRFATVTNVYNCTITIDGNYKYSEHVRCTCNKGLMLSVLVEWFKTNDLALICINGVRDTKYILDTLIIEKVLTKDQVRYICGDTDRNKAILQEYKRFDNTFDNVRLIVTTSSGYQSIDIDAPDTTKVGVFCYSSHYGHTRMSESQIVQCTWRFRNHDNPPTYLFGKAINPKKQDLINEFKEAERIYNSIKLLGYKPDKYEQDLLDSYIVDGVFYEEYIEEINAIDDIYSPDINYIEYNIDRHIINPMYIYKNDKYEILHYYSFIKLCYIRQGNTLRPIQGNKYYDEIIKYSENTHCAILIELIKHSYRNNEHFDIDKLCDELSVNGILRVKRLEEYYRTILLDDKQMKLINTERGKGARVGKAVGKAVGKNWNKPYTKEQFEKWKSINKCSSKLKNATRYIDEICNIVTD